jgi:uncharacterized protein (DUF488 family)
VSCESPRTVHTIGHSTRTIGILIELLKAHNIKMVVDVRRWPASRRLPHFHRESLNTVLKSAGIEYVWRGDLGGFRKPAPDSPNTAWRVGAFRAYADFMLTPGFQRIMSEVEELAANQRIALLCAEAVPWRCHRQLLADAFFARDWTVRHIMDNGCHEHKFPAFAQLAGKQIYYRG